MEFPIGGPAWRQAKLTEARDLTEVQAGPGLPYRATFVGCCIIGCCIAQLRAGLDPEGSTLPDAGQHSHIQAASGEPPLATGVNSHREGTPFPGHGTLGLVPGIDFFHRKALE